MEETRLPPSISVHNPCSILLLKSLDTTSQLYHYHRSFASEFNEITNIPIPRNLMLQRFLQDKVVMVDHLRFRQASAMTNPGQNCFIF